VAQWVWGWGEGGLEGPPGPRDEAGGRGRFLILSSGSDAVGRTRRAPTWQRLASAGTASQFRERRRYLLALPSAADNDDFFFPLSLVARWAYCCIEI
jgi:hypothetical protein